MEITTGLSLLDWFIVAIYLLLCICGGYLLGGKPQDARTYFRTGGDVPWWAASFSIVATETSLLTVISIPAVAYGGSLVFLQLVVGYIIGRILVSFLLLPAYFKGEIITPYQLFEVRFGLGFRKLSSLVFLITRLLADGIRLFAAAIPLKLITGLDYPAAIALAGGLTLAYTYYGGLKSVIWIDVLQLAVYTGFAFYLISFMAGSIPENPITLLAAEDKLTWLVWPESWSMLFTTPYTLIGAVAGGIFLSMASHGTDHLIVQRLLACGNLSTARKALISSGFFVFLQFALFLSIGLMLYLVYGGVPHGELGLNNPDEILIFYVLSQLPSGAAGLFVAALFAAAMSTLSSSLSALSSSTLFDLFPKLSEREDAMKISRLTMVVWTLIFVLFASMFTDTDNPIVELGLGIAGFTYGALLGSFFMALYSNIRSSDAVTALIACVASMTIIIFYTPLAWPWYTLCGLLIFAAFALSSALTRTTFSRT
ncbi:MAG: sodium:solute symporter [Balneolales bacterium]|nr:sodium:solute symporter [Balneolales bacterium]